MSGRQRDGEAGIRMQTLVGGREDPRPRDNELRGGEGLAVPERCTVAPGGVSTAGLGPAPQPSPLP